MSKNRPYWVMCPRCEEQFEMGTTDIPVEEIKVALVKARSVCHDENTCPKWFFGGCQCDLADHAAGLLGLTLEGDE